MLKNKKNIYIDTTFFIKFRAHCSSLSVVTPRKKLERLRRYFFHNNKKTNLDSYFNKIGHQSNGHRIRD